MIRSRELLAAVEGELPMAEFSPDRVYRYILRRRWNPKPPIGFILLNPSTADETQDDPTIRRCIGYAKALDAGGLVLGNLFALRATDPRELRSAVDPIGPGNDSAIFFLVEELKDTPLICGWGNHGTLEKRGNAVLRHLRQLQARAMALALTKIGEPAHPLYLKADLRPFDLFGEIP